MEKNKKCPNKHQTRVTIWWFRATPLRGCKKIMEIMPNFPFQVCGTRKVYQVTMLFLLRGFHMEHQESLHSYKCLRFQMLCITCSTVRLLPCILSRSKFFWQSVTRFLMDYVIRCINFDISCVQSIATLHDIRSLSSINKDGRSRNRKTSLSVSLTK